MDMLDLLLDDEGEEEGCRAGFEVDVCPNCDSIVEIPTPAIDLDNFTEVLTEIEVRCPTCGARIVFGLDAVAYYVVREILDAGLETDG